MSNSIIMCGNRECIYHANDDEMIYTECAHPDNEVKNTSKKVDVKFVNLCQKEKTRSK